MNMKLKSISRKHRVFYMGNLKYEKDGKVTVINALATSAIWNLSNLTEIPN